MLAEQATIAVYGRDDVRRDFQHSFRSRRIFAVQLTTRLSQLPGKLALTDFLIYANLCTRLSSSTSFAWPLLGVNVRILHCAHACIYLHVFINYRNSVFLWDKKSNLVCWYLVMLTLLLYFRRRVNIVTTVCYLREHHLRFGRV